MGLPASVNSPCNDCPWRRSSIPGWLGPHSADEWLFAAHGEVPIACHQTIREDGSWDGASQCKGVAQYRANVFKSPRDPEIAVGPRDTQQIFASQLEFKEHHQP